MLLRSVLGWASFLRDPAAAAMENGEGAVYGVPANLLRFILDLYGPSYSGGETALMRELTGSDQTGYSNLTTVTGDSIGLLLTLFGLNLWADGRIWLS